MPCNESGLTDLSAPETNFGVIDFDWSNAKALWVDAQPMNCEEMLMEQAKLTRAARPDAKVHVVRCGHPPLSNRLGWAAVFSLPEPCSSGDGEGVG